jgi:transposase-like protein
MTDATATRDRESKRFAYWSLLGCTTAVGAVTFVLSFVGLRDYAERVAGFPAELSWLVPVGVDGLTLCAVAATMILRHATWRPRAYAWAAFAIAVAASVSGNLSHADARGLSWEGHIGAASWPIFLALASHMVIVVRRNMERTSPRRTAATAPSATTGSIEVLPEPATPPVGDVTATAADEPAEAPAEPVRRQTPRRRAKPAKRTARGVAKTFSDDEIRAALRRCEGGESVAKVALSLGVHKATVYRWRDEQSRGAQDSGGGSADDTKEESRERDLVNVGA